MKKKVKNVKAEDGFDSQWGYFYKFIITFEDGMIAEYLSKSENQNKFIIGNEIDVEVTQREYNGQKINKVKPASNFQGGSRPAPKADNVQELIVKQNALTNALHDALPIYVAKIIEVAEVFSNWVLKDEKPTSTTKNDLPF
jgi:hypothetical protein